MPWLISGLISAAISIGGFLWRKRVVTTIAAASATLAYDIAKGGEKAAAAKAKAAELPKPPSSVVYWILAGVSLLCVVLFFLLGKKKGNKKDSDTDFYAGALGLSPEEACKVSSAYLKGQLSAKRREARWGNPGEILGLRPSGVTAHYGNKSFGGFDGRS